MQKTNPLKRGLSLPALMVTGLLFTTPVRADEDPQRYFAQATQALALAQPGKAERLLHRVLHLDPARSQARYRLIDLYFTQQRYDAALRIAENGLNLNPNDPELWVRKGLVLRESGTQAQAQAAYDKAESLAPDNPVILRRASGYYRHIGNLGKSQALNMRRKQLETIKGPGRENPGKKKDKKATDRNKPNNNSGKGNSH